MHARPLVFLSLLGLLTCGTPDTSKSSEPEAAVERRVARAADPHEVYTVYANGRGSRPMQVRRFEGAAWVEWELAFDDSAAYDFSGESYARDQYDWNKLVGLKWDFLRPRQNTLLVGWRWNLETQQIELAPYLHEDGGREMHPPATTLSPHERFTVRIGWTAERATFSFTRAGAKPVVLDYAFDVPTGDPWQILHWFGGTQAAPHDIALRVYATRTSADTATGN